MAGDVAIYSADTRNIHSVDEIKSGERLTLTLWFTRDPCHDEDARLISLLLSNNIPPPESFIKLSSSPLIALPASSNMYWFSSAHEEDLVEFDVRMGRLAVLGYDVCPVQEDVSNSGGLEKTLDGLSDSDVVLEKRLKLVRGDALLDVDFDNIMHALQVVQFCSWRDASLSQQEAAGGMIHKSESVVMTAMSQAQRESSKLLKNKLLKDPDVAKKVFVHPSLYGDHGKSSRSHEFGGEEGFCRSGAVGAWEEYSQKLHKQLVMSLPVWNDHQSIFIVQQEAENDGAE